jgi:hypothetical protein
MLDWYGGMHIISPEAYFAASLQPQQQDTQQLQGHPQQNQRQHQQQSQQQQQVGSLPQKLPGKLRLLPGISH